MYCRPRGMSVLVVLACLVSVCGPLSAATVYVDGSGKTGFSSIQAAVDACADGDVVILQPGTYTGRGNQDVSLQRKAIRIQSTDPEDPAVVEATIIDCAGAESDPHRGFYAVDFAGEIAGLTIRNGLASAGGAIYCQNSTLALKHCRIVGNATLAGSERAQADGGAGGGVYCEASAVEVVACLVSGNATGSGADSRDTLAGAGGDGAGIYSVSSLLSVSDSTISENTTGAGGNSEVLAGRGGNGAGIHSDSLLVTDSTIADNSCGQGGSGPQGGQGGHGAGIYCSRATVATTVIEANRAGTGGDSTLGTKGLGGLGGHGGGLFCQDSLDMRSSLIAGNRAGLAGGDDSTVAALAGRGGGVYCSSGVIDFCTIVGNAAFGQIVDGKTVASGSGGGVACNARTAVTNSILWDNTLDQIAGQDCANVLYCDIEDNTCLDGRSNISADPHFVEAGHWADPRDTEVAAGADEIDAVWVSGDYHLSDASPCIDAADPGYAAVAGETDLDGRTRVADAAADMGAYESQNLVPVYRFRSRQTNKYLYTASESEKDNLIGQTSGPWQFEGTAYYVYRSAVIATLKPVYRFWSAKLSSHLYTISESEKNRLMTQYTSDVWAFEGIAFYAYPEGSQPEGTKPVYRFWSDRLGGHFYTIDEAEKEQYRANTAMWAFEGVVWYAFDEPDEIEDPETPSDSATVYALTGGSDAASFVVQLKAYVDGQEARLDNATVTFTPAAGRMQLTVDFEAMTAEMSEFHIESEFVEHTTTVTLADAGVVDLPVALSLNGFFDALAPRGPYAIESRSMSFPTAGGAEEASDDDTYRIAGSGVVDGGKFDVNLTGAATEFELDGAATIDDSASPDRVDVQMDGPFQWNRRQQDLLLETEIKGHTLEIYVESVEVRSAGLWQGKNASQTRQEDRK